jgi:hypothetical protein
MEIELPDDFREFLSLLGSNGVEYLLIGGYAVGYHGYPRATGDLDIFIAISPERVLLNLGSPVTRFVILRERPRIT